MADQKDSDFKEAAEKIAEKLKSEMPEDFIEKLRSEMHNHGQFNYPVYVFLFCFLLVSSVLAFVGYKLYKSQKDRQRKAEEKQRLRQMKKKK